MKEIVRILMRRDGMTENEAWDLVDECQREIEYALRDGNLNDLEDIIKDYLGLEPDYLDAFLL